MFDAKEEKFFRRVLFAQELDTEYQSYFSREIVRYYQKKEQKPLVEQYLEQADYEQMPQAVRQYMMESLADWRMYDRLYEQMQEYGLDQIGSSAKVAVATYLLDAMEEREQDEELLLLCTSAFLNKKYNDRILQYLSDFYSGPRPCFVYGEQHRILNFGQEIWKNGFLSRCCIRIWILCRHWRYLRIIMKAVGRN